MKEVINIVEVSTKKQRHQFVSFPLKLYKDNPYFVPPIYMDEIALFKKNNINNIDCDQVFYLAYIGDMVVGRIQGIIQKQFNEINNKKQARFSRFDCIDDQKVANELFKAAENWAKEKGCNEIIGPMGYNDLEREGLLIEGFDYLSTYEEQYNHSYYQRLIEENGYIKDVDWLEYRLYPEFPDRERLLKIAGFAQRKLKLHVVGQNLSKRAYIKKYGPAIFEVLDECYKNLYGTVPFSDKIRDNIINNFKLVINLDYVMTVCDENEKVIAFGIVIPGIGKALQKSGGRLTIPTIFKLLKAIDKPKTLDMALIGVLPEYQKHGLNAFMLTTLQDMLIKNNIEYLETNLNLETNVNVQGQWRFFKHIQHKRRRAFIKKI